jgi:hypothetical protein
MKQQIYQWLALVLLSGFISVNAQAEQFTEIAGYVVHYNTMNTDMLPQAMAQQYDIDRSKNRALLNIAVRKGSAAELMSTQAVPANLTVTATNLNQQLKTVDMRMIEEADSIYYIGTFSISDAEVLDFVVMVTPEYEGEPHQVTFRQQFFVD